MNCGVILFIVQWAERGLPHLARDQWSPLRKCGQVSLAPSPLPSSPSFPPGWSLFLDTFGPPGWTLTFAVCDVGGTIKISAGVARTGDAVVLAKLRLIGAHGAADAPVGGGVVVVPWRAMYCRGTRRWGAGGRGQGSPRALKTLLTKRPLCLTTMR